MLASQVIELPDGKGDHDGEHCVLYGQMHWLGSDDH